MRPGDKKRISVTAGAVAGLPILWFCWLLTPTFDPTEFFPPVVYILLSLGSATTGAMIVVTCSRLGIDYLEDRETERRKQARLEEARKNNKEI